MRQTKIMCDASGCLESTEMTDKAGSLEGWLRRDVSDSCNKRMAEGMRDFGKARTFYLCPEHAQSAEQLASPPIHPEVLAFMLQPEPDTGER